MDLSWRHYHSNLQRRCHGAIAELAAGRVTRARRVGRRSRSKSKSRAPEDDADERTPEGQRHEFGKREQLIVRSQIRNGAGRVLRTATAELLVQLREIAAPYQGGQSSVSIMIVIREANSGANLMC